MEYVIGDGNGYYIRHDTQSGKYVTIRNETLAARWKEKYKAQNVLKNALCKKDKKRFKVIEFPGEEDNPPKVIIKLNPNISKVKEISDGEIPETELDKWESGLESFANFVQESEVRKEYLSEQLSEIDKEVVDIEHYIELNTLNASQGYLAYRMLRNRLRKRRKIKNELQILNQLGNCKLDSAMITDVKNAIKQLESKQYTPRVLADLFK